MVPLICHEPAEEEEGEEVSYFSHSFFSGIKINKKGKRKSMSDETLSNFLLFAKQTVKTLKAKQLALEKYILVMGYVFGINKEEREREV